VCTDVGERQCCKDHVGDIAVSVNGLFKFP
jgi:hypothetical protein